MADHAVLHSGYFHPVLRSWNSGNTLIAPDNLMFPLFIVWVFLCNKYGCFAELQIRVRTDRFSLNELDLFADDRLRDSTTFSRAVSRPQTNMNTESCILRRSVSVVSTHGRYHVWPLFRDCGGVVLSCTLSRSDYFFTDNFIPLNQIRKLVCNVTSARRNQMPSASVAAQLRTITG